METKICPACKNENENIRVECHICQFPFEGSEKEKAIHIGQFINKKGVIMDSDTGVHRSRIILAILGGINLLVLIFMFIGTGLLKNGIDNVVLTIVSFQTITTLIFIASAILIKRNPLLFISIPLGFLLLTYLIQFIISPILLSQGIFLKAFILVSLCYSLYLIIKSNRFKSKYQV